MQTLEKRSSETVIFDIDCSRLLATGETWSSITSSTAEPTTSPAIAFGSPAINSLPASYTDADTGIVRTVPAGQVIQVAISGGKIATGAQVQDYVLRFKGPTSKNTLVEATVRLKLNDTPAP